MRTFLLVCLGCALVTVSLNSNIASGDDSGPRKRFALFIANGEYQNDKEWPKLNNPLNDVKEVAKALGKAGFTSFIYEDLPYKQDMDGVVDAFLKLVSDEDIVWFYYAGHGIQGEDGKSYLIPTNLATSQETDLQKGAMSAQAVMQKLYDKGDRKNKGINIIVLDTCRNPYYGKSHELKSDLVGVGGGNVMVVFSTKAGEVAAEGGNRQNSPFAKALIDGINRYHWQQLEDVLQGVGEVVKDETSKQQVYVYGWVGKDFCLSQCLGTQNISITP